jgi:electron transfer flavoprotein beta subunit
MRIAVCCKGVPVEAMLESVHITGGDLLYKDTDFYINEVDAYALEAAVALKNAYQAETTALTMGPLRAQEVLYLALAKGIDQVLRVDGDSNRPEYIVSSLIPPLRELAPHLILVGVQSEDWMGGEVGVYLAEALGMGMAFAVTEISELTDAFVRVKKEIGEGRKADLKVALPAVLCVQTGIQPLRYLSAMKRQKVRNMPIKSGGKLDPEAVKQNMPTMLYHIRSVSLPSREGHAEMLAGDRSELAGKLLEIVRSSL